MASFPRTAIITAVVGVGVGVAISYVYVRLTTPRHYKNPNWGLARVKGVALAKQESEAAAKQVEAVRRELAACKAAADQRNSIHKEDLPESILKKHPKGCGMDLVKIDAPVRSKHDR